MKRAGLSKSRRPTVAKQTERSKLLSIQSKVPSRREALTPRERAVLKQIGRGASSKEAGAALGVSARTIEFHRANIMRKLGVRKIVDLMLFALREDKDH
jgi:DNA-binding NarL/FixJ family response regulator